MNLVRPGALWTPHELYKSTLLGHHLTQQSTFYEVCSTRDIYKENRWTAECFIKAQRRRLFHGCSLADTGYCVVDAWWRRWNQTRTSIPLTTTTTTERHTADGKFQYGCGSSVLTHTHNQQTSRLIIIINTKWKVRRGQIYHHISRFSFCCVVPFVFVCCTTCM